MKPLYGLTGQLENMFVVKLNKIFSQGKLEISKGLRLEGCTC